jgi:hypothetical protein
MQVVKKKETIISDLTYLKDVKLTVVYPAIPKVISNSKETTSPTP